MKNLPLLLAAAVTLSFSACNPNDTSASGAASSDVVANGQTAANAEAANADSKMADGNINSNINGDMTPAGKADPNGPTGPHTTDAEFMMTAAHSDQNGIQQSKMALAKGVTGTAKEMADRMIADYTKSTADLKVIAAKKGVKLPADMDAEHKNLVPTMEKLTGKDFEAKYLAQMKIDHQKTANTMAAHENMTQDADLKAFINKTLPVVEQHLQMADRSL